MSTTQTPPAASTATSTSALQKLEAWFLKAKLKIEGALASIVGPTLAGQIETAFAGILCTAEGQLAQKVVTEMADAASGQVNVGQAVSATIAAVAATGKSITQSAATTLVAAAQQKVLSIAQQS